MLYDEINRSVDHIRTFTGRVPKLAIMLGSGLGGVVDAMEDRLEVPYSGIPGFPESHIEGHSGMLVFGRLEGVETVAMQGRCHYYEGFGMRAVTFPIYVLRALGAKKLIVTNACGAINPEFRPGELLLITDFINLTGLNPLVGGNDERLGPRFPDMSEPFTAKLRAAAEEAAAELGTELRKGVYAFFNGPCFETAAEIRALAVMGADAVGMSTVPETIVANYLGMEVLGLACMTNMATGLADRKHSHAEVLRVANESSAKLCALIKAVAGRPEFR